MLVFLISIITLIIDQYSKYLAIINLADGPIEIISGVFSLSLVYNSGAAFGIFQNYRWFFLISTPIIILAVIVFLILNRKKSIISNISLAFVIGGAFGNYIDRIKYGYVIDFIDFKVWPVFNMADTFVVIGTILFAYYIYFMSDSTEKQEDTSSERN